LDSTTKCISFQQARLGKPLNHWTHTQLLTSAEKPSGSVPEKLLPDIESRVRAVKSVHMVGIVPTIDRELRSISTMSEVPLAHATPVHTGDAHGSTPLTQSDRAEGQVEVTVDLSCIRTT
jgi:hypothetical protein